MKSFRQSLHELYRAVPSLWDRFITYTQFICFCRSHSMKHSVRRQRSILSWNMLRKETFWNLLTQRPGKDSRWLRIKQSPYFDSWCWESLIVTKEMLCIGKIDRSLWSSLTLETVACYAVWISMLSSSLLRYSHISWWCQMTFTAYLYDYP